MTNPASQAAREAAAEALGYKDWADATDYRLSGAQDRERERVLQAFVRFEQQIREEVGGGDTEGVNCPAKRGDGAICKARLSSQPERQDCDWPHCGCDPPATRVVESLIEEGWLPPVIKRDRQGWEDRIRELMKGLGFEHSMSHYQAFKQFQVEIELEYRGNPWAALASAPARGVVDIHELADRVVSAANIVTHDGYYEVDISAVERILGAALRPAAPGEVEKLREALEGAKIKLNRYIETHGPTGFDDLKNSYVGGLWAEYQAQIAAIDDALTADRRYLYGASESKTAAFQREDRYIVIKRKHLANGEELLVDNCSPSSVECVVVERDWPEYETVWRMIEDRVAGRQALSPTHPERAKEAGE